VRLLRHNQLATHSGRDIGNPFWAVNPENHTPRHHLVGRTMKVHNNTPGELASGRRSFCRICDTNPAMDVMRFNAVPRVAPARCIRQGVTVGASDRIGGKLIQLELFSPARIEVG
jgi:hypothetical protein